MPLICNFINYFYHTVKTHVVTELGADMKTCSQKFCHSLAPVANKWNIYF